jgi:hypothetical protein
MKEGALRKIQKAVERWVVFKSRLAGAHGPNAVCEQAEWDAMEKANPGDHTLLQTGVASEAEAERLARDLPGGTAVKGARLKAREARSDPPRMRRL